MEQTLEMTGRADLLPADLPFFWVAVIFALAALLWAGARWFTRKYEAKLPPHGMLAARMVTAVIAAWAGYQVIGRGVEYGCRWPLWAAALGTGLAVEAVAALYGRERKVVPARLGMTLAALRALVVALSALLIMQPVFVRSKARNIEKRVVVLVDESASMGFEDRLWTASEKLAWGRGFGHIPASANPLPSLPRLAGLHARLQPWAVSENPDDHDGRLAALLESGLSAARAVQAELDACVRDHAPASNNGMKPQREAMEGVARLLGTSVAPSLEAAAAALREGGGPQLIRVADALAQFEAAAPAARLAADEAFWGALDEAARGAVDALCATTRVHLARGLLTGAGRGGGAAFLDRLASRYDVDLHRMGASLQRVPRLSETSVVWDPEPGASTNLAAAATNGAAAVETAAAGLPDEFFAAPAGAPQPGVKITWDLAGAATQAFRMTTDFTSALETLMNEISSERFAGVIMLTDGLHNGPASFDPIARRYGAQRIPVMGVTVGGSRQPFDIAVADVIAPESIFLGDNVRVRAVMRATNARGKKLNVQLLFEGTNVVDAAEVEVTEDVWQREIRFKHQPAERGIVRYEVRTDVLEDELFDDNNAWAVDVAVSDDRTNVLLVDNVPRWEFRYLRNLFFGRDKSVHLQYVLIHPDTIAETTHPAVLPPASAGRPFGEAEAGSLPVSREEWRKFDVIILGDLPPDVLTEEVMGEIKHCVDERGALLVVIAGPEAMPHAHPETSTLREKLLPIKSLDPAHLYPRRPPDADGYTLALTPAGKAHAVMQQSASFAENESIWQQMPDLAWRVPLFDLKPGAEALAYAQPKADPLAYQQRFDIENAAALLEETMRRQTRNAIIIASRVGRGKVLTLMFDRTWRFRYRVGDTHHHRFWGQVMRWGAGEKLRSGDEFFRVGTDQVVYTPGAPVQIMGRVLNPDGTYVQGAALEAAVARDDGTILGRQRLNYREDSNGLYEAEFKGVETPGRYTVRLHRRDSGAVVETQFLVTPTRRPVELADVAANPADLERLARWTGGRVVEPDHMDQLLDAFGEGRRTVHERVERPLWDNPLLFILIVALLTTEWLLRKKGNLA